MFESPSPGLQRKEALKEPYVYILASGRNGTLYTGVTGDFGTSLNRIIKTDASGYFDTTFVLEQPTYFNISRNILYLSPGDDLEVYLTPDTRQATFKGKGSEAQLFLKDRLYPKGGSFLLSGRNVRENFEKTKEVVDALAASKLAQLDTNKDGFITAKDPEFKHLYLWKNKSGDGVSQKQDLIPLGKIVEKISLSYKSGHLRPIGKFAEEREKSFFWFKDKTGIIKKGQIVDIWLAPK